MARYVVTGCAGFAQRMQLRAPERLVDVDVPQAGDGALVEQRGLDGGAASGEPSREPRSREPGPERLGAVADVQVRLHLLGLEQPPGAEAADIPVRDVRSVV